MKKRFMALCLTFIFLINVFSIVSVSAATYSSPLKNFVISKYAESVGIDSKTAAEVFQGNINIEVPTDIKVRASGSGAFVNGPVSMVNNGVNNVDFEASIDMTQVKESVQLFKDAGMNLINLYGANDTEKTALINELNSCEVEGSFVIGVKYPQIFTLPSSIFNGNMTGFSSTKDYTQIFEEPAATRQVNTATAVNGIPYNVAYIHVDVKDGVNMSVLENYLDDLKLTCENISVGATGTYSIMGVVSGSVKIISPTYSEQIGSITYTFSQEPSSADTSASLFPGKISGTVIVTAPSAPSVGPGSRADKKLEIVYGDGIENDVYKFDKGTKVNLKELTTKTKPGYSIVGYYAEPEFVTPVENEFNLNENTTVYVKWLKDVLDSSNHFAYVIGYPVEETGRNEVRPENNISREEITTIFYRLLKPEERDRLFTTENNFTDVSKDRWSNKAISTMANGKYIIGYEDGTFNPEGFITRAEFVTIAARFYNVDESTFIGSSATFPDISSHWAENYIKYALGANWIQGYEDHTFRPDAYITRAEVMRIINNMLNRHVNEEGLCEDVKRWDDNPADAWYYYDVIEATNSHDYERAGGATAETWTKVTENKVWVEKEYYEDAD